MPMSFVNLKGVFNSLSVVKELLFGGRGRKSMTDAAVTIDEQQSNFTEKTDELDDLSSSLNDNHDGGKVECTKHMECPTYAQCEKCPELLSDKEKEKRDDHMKTHSSSGYRKMDSTGQSPVPESSRKMDSTGQSPVPESSRKMDSTGLSPAPESSRKMDSTGQSPVPESSRKMDSTGQSPVPETSRKIDSTGLSPVPESSRKMDSTGQSPVLESSRKMDSTGQSPVPESSRKMDSTGQSPVPETSWKMDSTGLSPVPESSRKMDSTGQSPVPESSRKMYSTGHSPVPESSRKMDSTGQSPVPETSRKMDSTGQSPVPESSRKMDSTGQSPVPESSRKMDSTGHSPVSESSRKMDSTGQSPVPESSRKIDSTGLSPVPESSRKMDSTGQSPVPESSRKMDSTGQRPVPESSRKMDSTDQSPVPESSRKMDSTGQSPVPETSAEKEGGFMNGHADILGETVSKKCKLGHLNASKEESVPVCSALIAARTVGPPGQMIGEKGGDLHNTPNGNGVLQETIAGGSEKPKGHHDNEISVNTGEALDAGLQTSKSPKGMETVGDNGNKISVTRQFECRLCFNVWRNKLLFWEHLHTHSKEVPSTCKNCAEVFDDENLWKIHNRDKCCCAACGKLILGSSASVHAKGCQPYTCSGCSKRFQSLDVFRDHWRSHIGEKSYVCRVCRKIFLSKADADRHKVHRNICLNPVVTGFTSEVDLLDFDFFQNTEMLSHVPDEERDKVMERSSVNLRSELNSSALDSLSVGKDEPLYGGRKSMNDIAGTVDVQENNFQFECRLCFSVLRNKLLFWEHLHTHSKEVPSTCKNCANIFDDEKSWKIHNMDKCCCAACGKLILGSSASVHAKGCQPFTCSGCSKRFQSLDVFRDHWRSHIREKSEQHKVHKNICLDSVRFHRNIPAGEAPSESECLSPPSSTLSSSSPCSSNGQLVIDDGVKNMSIRKSLAELNTPHLKASTEDMVENKEASGEQQAGSITGSATDNEALVTHECESEANECIGVVCHVCTSVVTVEKMLDMHLLFGQLKCKNCDLQIACCNMMKTFFYGHSICSGNKQQGKHDFTVWCSDVIEYILDHLKRDLIIKNFCKYDRNIPVYDNDLCSELQDYIGKLAILRKYCPWNSALHDCDQYILSQMSAKTYSVSNTNTHPTDPAKEYSIKADLLSFQGSRSLELMHKKNAAKKDFERDKGEFVRVAKKRGRPPLAAKKWDFPKDKRYLKISITENPFSCPEECPECYSAICPSRFTMKVSDFTLKYTCVECHLPIFFVFESDEENCRKWKRVK
ncbi:uncharacterized protein [Macrobrachium rosenbergii]|uniref:uncharacterized protein n=1 Tax=Macrobrachium rosenbergii TaxID=79674 RepID=UPI0034D64701